ncbi:sensor histidine kinase [Nocardia sp. XZ_19_385]|uniref:sensor histidine kinase n=1 Tax=Nocardia sp. XZ_19_385 TaxID=2769488 RepID=UPI00188E28DD|nr:sensor histidine kinase [Nocardia sp. XZ_19_385]
METEQGTAEVTVRRPVSHWWTDGLLAAALLIAELIAATLIPSSRPLDGFGALLLILATAPLAARTYAPVPVLIAHLATAIPYHANEFPHEAIIPATIVALYTAARHGNRRRTAVMVAAVLTFGLGGILMSGEDSENIALQAFGAIGWIVLACVAGEAVRLHRAYIAEVLDRAERAERSRDEEARRQVAEERLRIARDLHDLLAHTITVIQVQAGVAAHLLTERQAEPATVLGALDTISGACADARAELSATVGVLRTPGSEARGPLPALAQVHSLAALAEAAGVTVEFETTGPARRLTPTVEMVGYRIVQEALTNVAKHGCADHTTVRLEYHPDRLVIRVSDDGRGSSNATPGFGIRGMMERAEAIGGTVLAEGSAKGFTVTADLPVAADPTAGPPAEASGSDLLDTDGAEITSGTR